MTQVDPNSLWFQTVDTFSLCRGGGNGPNHPSQLYAILKYCGEEKMSFLEYGSGSGTTYEAMKNCIFIKGIHERLIDYFIYRGMDIIPKNVEWCKQTFPEADFKVNSKIHEIDELDTSWDVVYSRHVVDHMESFEKAMDEMKRVSKNLIITVFWVPMSSGDEHEIKNIVDAPGTDREKLYPNEYTNSYSRKKVMEYLNNDPSWELLELAEEIGKHDWIIVLKKKLDKS